MSSLLSISLGIAPWLVNRGITSSIHSPQRRITNKLLERSSECGLAVKRGNTVREPILDRQ